MRLPTRSECVSVNPIVRGPVARPIRVQQEVHVPAIRTIESVAGNLVMVRSRFKAEYHAAVLGEGYSPDTDVGFSGQVDGVTAGKRDGRSLPGERLKNNERAWKVCAVAAVAGSDARSVSTRSQIDYISDSGIRVGS